MCKGVKSRYAGAAKRPELVEYVVEEFIEAAIENDLVRNALVSMFFVEGIKIVLCKDLCSFLYSGHFLLYLICIILLVIREKTI